MIYQCNYCFTYFSDPVEYEHWVDDPRGYGYPTYRVYRNHCPFCGSDDLEEYTSLIEYRGRFYRSESHLAHVLDKKGYTQKEIEKALEEAIEIREV